MLDQVYKENLLSERLNPDFDISSANFSLHSKFVQQSQLIKSCEEIQEIIKGLVSQFSSAEETITDTKIWCMSAKMALVDVYQTINGQKLPSGNIAPPRRIRMTQIYEKRDGRWQIKVYRVADLREMRQNRPTNESKMEQQ